MSALNIAAFREISPRHARIADWISSHLPPESLVMVRPDPRPIRLVREHGPGPYRVLRWEDCGDDFRPTIATPDGDVSLDPAWLVRVDA